MEAISLFDDSVHEVYLLGGHYYIKSFSPNIIILNHVINNVKEGFEYQCYKFNGMIYDSFYSDYTYPILNPKKISFKEELVKNIEDKKIMQLSLF